MNNKDQILVEEIRSYLGLDAHNRTDDQRLSLGSEHIRNYIEDAYRLKGNKFLHHDAIITAFTKTHHNMYIDDPAFSTTFKKEMTARGIPDPEIEKALDAVDNVLDKVFKEFGTKQEKDGGIHPKWNEIEEVSKPEQPENGELIGKKEYGQLGNIESDLPINRKKHGPRHNPVLETVVTEIKRQAKTPRPYHESEWDVPTPIGDAYVKGRVYYDAVEYSPATRWEPEEGGYIEVYKSEVTSAELYDEQFNNRPVGPHELEIIKKSFHEMAQSPEMADEIAEKLGEQEQAALDDHNDHQFNQAKERRNEDRYGDDY